jgi:hypothetical protein
MAQDGFDFDTELALLVGDINGDGVVDARDARLAAGHNNGATMKRDPHTGGQMGSGCHATRNGRGQECSDRRLLWKANRRFNI